MKKIFITLFVLANLLSVLAFTDNVATKSQQFTKELKSFIDTVKPGSIRKGKYLVFVANIYHLTSPKKDFCFTLGYIMNSNDLKRVTPDYVYYFGDEIVLIRMNPKTDKDFCNELKCKRLESLDSTKIAGKMFPSSKGGITAVTKGLVYLNTKEKIQKRFYNDDSEIPLDKSIWGNFPSGVIIKQIK